MNLERRKFVRGVGSGAVIWAAQLGAAPSVATASAQPADPYAAWRPPAAGSVEPRLYCLSYAILAPNPHNRQPWLIELRGRDEMVIHLDRTRLLPHTDPYARQLMVGHGAFLELLSLAASSQGLQAQIKLFPRGAFGEQPDDRPVAEVRLVAAEAPIARDPLFDRITARRTVRSAYDMQRPPTEAELQAVTSAAMPGLRGLNAFVNGVPTPRPRFARSISRTSKKN